MLGILLTTLKIIGIILLVVLCLLVLLLLIVLFVPFRYRADGYYKDNKFFVRANVSYLLHIISFTVKFDGKKETIIRLFGIKIHPDRWKRKKKTVKKRNEKTEALPENAKEQFTSSDSDEIHEETGESKTDADIVESKTDANVAQTRTDTGAEKTDDVSKAEKPESESSAESTEADIKKKKADQSGDSGKRKKQNITKNKSDNKKGLRYYIELMRDESTKLAISQCLKRIGILFKAILPKKGKIVLKLGLDNAGTVGEILGFYRALYMYIGKVVKFYPVYTEKVIETEFDVKGHISMIVVLHQIIVILLDKNCRKLIKIFRE